MRNELGREAYQQLAEGLRKNGKIERFNMDGSKLDTPPAAPPLQPKN